MENSDISERFKNWQSAVAKSLEIKQRLEKLEISVSESETDTDSSLGSISDVHIPGITPYIISSEKDDENPKMAGFPKQPNLILSTHQKNSAEKTINDKISEGRRLFASLQGQKAPTKINYIIRDSYIKMWKKKMWYLIKYAADSEKPLRDILNLKMNELTSTDMVTLRAFLDIAKKNADNLDVSVSVIVSFLEKLVCHLHKSPDLATAANVVLGLIEHGISVGTKTKLHGLIPVLFKIVQQNPLPAALVSLIHLANMDMDYAHLISKTGICQELIFLTETFEGALAHIAIVTLLSIHKTEEGFQSLCSDSVQHHVKKIFEESEVSKNYDNVSLALTVVNVWSTNVKGIRCIADTGVGVHITNIISRKYDDLQIRHFDYKLVWSLIVVFMSILGGSGQYVILILASIIALFGAIIIWVKMLRNRNESQKLMLHACNALGNISKMDVFHKENLVGVIVKCVEDNRLSEEIRSQALLILRNTALDDECRAYAASSGVLSSLGKMLIPGNFTKLTEHVIGVLVNLAQGDQELKIMAAKTGGIFWKITEIIRNPNETSTILIVSCMFLGNVANCTNNEEIKSLFEKEKILEALCDIMTSREEDKVVTPAVITAIGKVADLITLSYQESTDLEERLTQFVHNASAQDDEIVNAALISLNVLYNRSGRYNDNQNVPEILPNLLQHLKHVECGTNNQFLATYLDTLCNLLHANDRVKREAIDHDIIPILIDLIDLSHKDQNENCRIGFSATACLTNILHIYERAHIQAMDKNAVMVVRNYVKSRMWRTEISNLACVFLSNMLSCLETLPRAVQCNVVPFLITTLSKSDRTVSELGLAALGNTVFRNVTARKEAMNNGAIKTIAVHLRHSVTAAGMLPLCNLLTRDQDATKQTMDENIVPLLIKYLHTELNDQVRQIILSTLGHLASNSRNALEQYIEEDLVSHLVNCIKFNRNNLVVREALVIICKAVHHSELARTQATKEKFITFSVNHLRNCNISADKCALEVIILATLDGLLINNKPMADSAVKDGVIPLLMARLNDLGNPELLRSVISVLAKLVFEHVGAQKESLSKGAIKKLKKKKVPTATLR